MNHDPNRDPNPDPANDNGGAIAPASKGSALASAALTALTATFKTVDTTSIGGRPIPPILQFKSREGGIWAFGKRANHPRARQPVGGQPRLRSSGAGFAGATATRCSAKSWCPISQPLPDVTELPDKGFPWQQEMAVNLKCISGTDAGTEVVFKTNTEGGKGEVVRLIEAVRDRLGGQHDGKVSPIVRLENSSYQHPQYGKTGSRCCRSSDWMPLDGPAPAPDAGVAAAASEQPRRRRVA